MTQSKSEGEQWISLAVWKCSDYRFIVFTGIQFGKNDVVPKERGIDYQLWRAQAHTRHSNLPFCERCFAARAESKHCQRGTCLTFQRSSTHHTNAVLKAFSAHSTQKISDGNGLFKTSTPVLARSVKKETRSHGCMLWRMLLRYCLDLCGTERYCTAVPLPSSAIVKCNSSSGEIHARWK